VDGRPTNEAAEKESASATHLMVLRCRTPSIHFGIIALSHIISGELTVTSEHTIAVNDLPPLHKDPFDRILVAQARVEGFLLLTVDKMVTKYGEGVRKV
jgi:PIN domain nuclease of toxin-antitoxin system